MPTAYEERPNKSAIHCESPASGQQSDHAHDEGRAWTPAAPLHQRPEIATAAAATDPYAERRAIIGTR